MSKRKIDETMTEARNGRAKKKVDEAMLPPIVPRAKRSKKADAPVGEPEPEAKPAKEKAPKEKPPKEDFVVFAFRLKATERDLIHKAAGAAKASRFVRALMIAASKGDEKTVVEIVRAVKEETASAS
jgi:hypothetical protein